MLLLPALGTFQEGDGSGKTGPALGNALGFSPQRRSDPCNRGSSSESSGKAVGMPLEIGPFWTASVR